MQIQREHYSKTYRFLFTEPVVGGTGVFELTPIRLSFFLDMGVFSSMFSNSLPSRESGLPEIIILRSGFCLGFSSALFAV